MLWVFIALGLDVVAVDFYAIVAFLSSCLRVDSLSMEVESPCRALRRDSNPAGIGSCSFLVLLSPPRSAGTG